MISNKVFYEGNYKKYLMAHDLLCEQGLELRVEQEEEDEEETRQLEDEKKKQEEKEKKKPIPGDNAM